MDRRVFVGAVFAAPLLLRSAFAAGPPMQVARSPSCGCCSAWIAHVRANGFAVEIFDLAQEALDAVKARVGVPPDAISCHTAIVGGYFVEGHVPAEDIRRLLAERPDARGLAVPGMPLGSPGMEMGDERETFETLLVARDGRTSVFARHEA